jgi:hypothetical protein
MTLLHGRHVGPLLTVWGGGLLLAAGLYWLQAEMPAFVDIVTPLYIVLGVILIISSFKWLRERNEQRRHGDRRHADRRHASRHASQHPPAA